MTGDIVPQTRGWQAAIETVEPPILRVSGEIELGNMNERPSLSLSEPANPDPSVLVLNLDVVIDGPSELAMHWAAVAFRHPISGAAPKTLRLLWMGVEIASLTVTE